jgi:hypothetical protein
MNQHKVEAEAAPSTVRPLARLTAMAVDTGYTDPGKSGFMTMLTLGTASLPSAMDGPADMDT